MSTALAITEVEAPETSLELVRDDGEKYAITLNDSQLRSFFTAEDGLIPITSAIRDHALQFDLDASTAKGRQEIKSLAHKITRSKTYLDGIGKEMVAELKDLPRKIDANRKMMRDTLDILADSVRQPVTEFEEHTKALSDRLNWLDALPSTLAMDTAEEIGAQLATVRDMPMTPEAWEGLYDEAKTIYERTLYTLTNMQAAKTKSEAEAAELEKLRAQAAERERKDAEAARIQEAADNARRAAEQRAEQERQAALGREAEAKRQTELAKQREAEAEQRAKDAEARAKAEAEAAPKAATEAEAKRQADAEQAEADAKAAREANKAHCRQINSEMLEDIEAAIADQFTAAPQYRTAKDFAKAVAVAIIKGQVRHTAITY
jgi:DNA repair exonuclease SbcCD ATPase subunit